MLLEKKGSRQRIEIITDANDDWFLYVKHVVIKSGIVENSSMIIRKDLSDWLRYLGTMGWELKEE